MAMEYADKVIFSLYLPATFLSAILAKKPPAMSRNGFLFLLLQQGLNALDKERTANEHQSNELRVGA